MLEMLGAIEEGGSAFILFGIMVVGIFIALLVTISR
ncbi:hypothetical protein BH20ACT24_BH20ACT24_13210 [soil metagenome]